MTKVTYEQALIVHLQQIAQERELTFEEWEILFDSLKDNRPVLQDFSPRREDWYGDDGR
jgi:predicted DNA-binding ribbon-helix-helix protein